MSTTPKGGRWPLRGSLNSLSSVNVWDPSFNIRTYTDISKREQQHSPVSKPTACDSAGRSTESASCAVTNESVCLCPGGFANVAHAPGCQCDQCSH